MTPERRYTEAEVSEILDRATEAQSEQVSMSAEGGGLTLRELHEIGREVGISEEVITTAATHLDRSVPDAAAQRTFLRQTIGVGRAVDLPRTPTEEEWHRLVMDLRSTFNAAGKIEDVGPFREWRNGNLHAVVEPTEDGARLHLRTLKGSARSFQTMGAILAITGAAMGAASLLGLAGSPADAVFVGGMGLGAFLWSRLTVPSWAKTRARQFEELIARVTHSLSRSPGDVDALPPGSERDAET